jgi:hypothetical protein
MYFEFLFLRAHSRSLVDRMYWSGVSLNSFTTCSNDVTVGTTGPIGSGLPQLGFPRRFAISLSVPLQRLTSELHLHTQKTRNLHSKAFMWQKQAVKGSA